MPVILAAQDYERWLGEEPDPHDLMRPFPAHLMRIWPISTRVNKPANDDPAILEPITYRFCSSGAWFYLLTPARIDSGLKVN